MVRFGFAWGVVPVVLALAACGTGDAGGGVGSAGDAITSIPKSNVRDQRETGNCWLYATIEWVESLEFQAGIEKGTASADDPASKPPPFSVSYYDYWDWYDRIAAGEFTAKKVATDDLDSGGSWGSAVELILKHGLVRAKDFGATSVTADAVLTTRAATAMAKSLTSGALATTSARKDLALVKRELDRAFALKGDFSAAVIRAEDVPAIVPHPDGTREVLTLVDVIGERVPGAEPDQRTGPHAWSDVAFKPTSPDEIRSYFQRIQRALHAGVPLPVGWFFPDNVDPNDTGEFREPPSEPCDDSDSVDHETLISDYTVENVPGFGRLEAGTPASKEQEDAALDPAAKIVFFRVTDSYGVVHGKKLRPTRDLYTEFLVGNAKSCPNGDGKSPKCTIWDRLLEDVTFPAGF